MELHHPGLGHTNDMDWKWMGSVDKKIPFNADHYFRWRKYYPYCAGLWVTSFLTCCILTCWQPVVLNFLLAGSLGNKGCTDKNTGTYERDVDENVQVIVEFQVVSAFFKQHGE